MPKRILPKIITPIIVFSLAIILFMLMPVYADEVESTNFRIRGENVSGAGSLGTSATYSINADLNPFSDLNDSSSFRQELGYSPRINANTPYPATLANSDNYYDRLLLTIDDSDNPAETLFAVAISDDNFATVSYVQNDGTVGAALGIEDYLSYSSWGGGSGSYILGLNQNTTYKVRVKALNGDFTETGYSSDSNEATTTVPFVNIAVSDTSLTLGVLNINSISQTTTLTVRVNTNAYTGYQVYVNDTGNGVTGGLFNGSGSLITSADMTLTEGVNGFGAQGNSATATVDSKYDVSGNIVGALEISTNPLASNVLAVTDEDTSVLFKAALSPSTIAGNYTDIVYFTITPNL